MDSKMAKSPSTTKIAVVTNGVSRWRASTHRQRSDSPTTATLSEGRLSHYGWQVWVKLLVATTLFTLAHAASGEAAEHDSTTLDQSNTSTSVDRPDLTDLFAPFGTYQYVNESSGDFEFEESLALSTYKGESGRHASTAKDQLKWRGIVEWQNSKISIQMSKEYKETDSPGHGLLNIPWKKREAVEFEVLGNIQGLCGQSGANCYILLNKKSREFTKAPLGTWYVEKEALPSFYNKLPEAGEFLPPVPQQKRP